MNSFSFRATEFVEKLRYHRVLVAFFVIAFELVVFFLDAEISPDVPITQLHWVSIILATTVWGKYGALFVSISATFLFYLANFVGKERSIDWTVLPSLILTFFLFILVGGATLTINRLLYSLENSNKALAEKLHLLQASTARIELLTAERERNRLARELHDGVVKTLFGIEYAAGALEKLLPGSTPPGDKARQQARFIQDVSHKEGLAVRDIITDLRHGYEEPLFKLISDYLRRWHLAYGHQVHFAPSSSDNNISPNLAYEVMAILDEALENVQRHSRANAVWVAVKTEPHKTLSLEIRDNGQGLTQPVQDILKAKGYPGKMFLDQPLSDSSGKQHFGLTGIFERTLWLNGELELTHAPEGGLGLKASIPVS